MSAAQPFSRRARPLLRPRSRPLLSLRALAEVGLYLAAYVLLDWASYILPVAPLGITPWNPSAGLSLVLLLRRGLRYWPALPAACLLAEHVTRGLPNPAPVMLAALCITAGYTLCAAVLRRRLTRGAELQTLRELAWFLGTTLVCTLLVAACYVGVFTAAGSLNTADFLSHFLRFWIGEFDGVLVVAPLLLTLRLRRLRVPWRAAIEIAAQALVLAGALWLVFRQPHLAQFQFFYVLFLPLVWIVVRHGIRGAAIALALIQLGLIAVVPNAEVYATTFIRYQFLITSLCVTGLALGSVESQRRRADAALQRKNELLARALQVSATAEVASALAHELNQPITAITNYVGASRLLAQAQVPPHARLLESLDKAAQETRRAADVVRRLRDFFRTGHLQLAPVQPSALIAGVMARIESRAAAGRVHLVLRGDSGLPTLMADEVQLESLLHNLLGNALDALESEATPDPRIQIEAQLDGDALLVAVEDNGPGVPVEHVDRLFEPFFTTRSRGMGLGLAISRTLAQAHGGDLRYRPATRRGSRFELRLPLKGSHHV